MMGLGIALALAVSASPAKLMLDRVDEAAWLARSGICGDKARQAEIAALDVRLHGLQRKLSERTGEKTGIIRLDGAGECAEADHFERHALRYRNAMRDAHYALGEE